MSEFVDMGGYGWYVWSAYGISLIVLALNLIWARRLNRKILAEIKRNNRQLK